MFNIKKQPGREENQNQQASTKRKTRNHISNNRSFHEELDDRNTVKFNDFYSTLLFCCRK